MKIGFDLDGVLAEFTTSYLQYYNDEHNTHYNNEQLEQMNLAKLLNVTHDALKKSIVAFFTTPFAKTILPVKGTQKAIQKLAKKHELHIITSRPVAISKLTLEWLNDFFPDTFASIHFTNDWLIQPEINKMKADICLEQGIDILVEDYLPYAEACAACVKHYILLFDRPWNRKKIVKPNVVRVTNWSAVLAFITKSSL